jgi:predicted DNA-binding transcriptional regulator AlpA
MSNTRNTEDVVPELLTTAEAARLCSIGERTLWRWSRSGIAPAPVKIGGTAVRYRRDEYLAWIAARCPRADRSAEK